MRISNLCTFALMLVGGVAMGMPVYKADYAGTYAADTIAKLNDPNKKVTKSSLKHDLDEIIMNLANTSESQRPGLQGGLIELFCKLSEEGKYFMTAEIDHWCNSLPHAIGKLLEQVVERGLERSQDMSKEDKKIFESGRDRRHRNHHQETFKAMKASLALSEADREHANAKGILREMKDALEHAETAANRAARNNALKWGVAGTVVTGLGTAAALACPITAPAVITTRIAMGAAACTAAGGASAAGVGYIRGYDGKEVAKASLAVTNAEIKFNAAKKALAEIQKEQQENQKPDTVFRQGKAA